MGEGSNGGPPTPPTAPAEKIDLSLRPKEIMVDEDATTVITSLLSLALGYLFARQAGH